MDFVYPALFHPNKDGSITITYPDLPGCVSEGKNLTNAMYMAQDALKQWLEYQMDRGSDIPPASAIGDVKTESGEFANLIFTEARDSRAVRRTISIPKWMDERVRELGLSLSRITQDALRDKIESF